VYKVNYINKNKNMEKEKVDLESFRKQWLTDLAKNKSSDNKTKQKRHHENDTGSSNLGNKSKIKQTGKLSTSITRKESTAFDVANKYLQSSKPCKFCLNEIKNRKTNSNNGKKQNCFCKDSLKKQQNKNTNPNPTNHNKEKSDSANHDKEKSNLTNHDKTKTEQEPSNKFLDILIADIDEINSIPFFDLELPKELATQIFQYLPVKDLLNCALVNSKWKVLAEDDMIWWNLCTKLDIDQSGNIDEVLGWKEYVKSCSIEKAYKQSKWKERICQVKELENEKAGIICAADLSKTLVSVAYIDGSIRVWNLADATFGHNLKERHTNDEQIVLSMCTVVKLTDKVCVAGFKNGDVMIWRIQNLTSEFVFMNNYESSEIENLQINSLSTHILIKLKQKCIIISEDILLGGIENRWNWNQIYENTVDNLIDIRLINGIERKPPQLLSTTKIQLKVTSVLVAVDNSLVLDELIGASFSCIDIKYPYIVAAIGSVGYSMLDGYRIRRYNASTGQQISNIIGCQTEVTCLNYKDCYDDMVLIGCSDHTIRIHDFKSESLLLTIHGVNSNITTLQMDKWKIVSGHRDGTICLWDSENGFKYWQTNMKHPVHICYFDESLLTCINIPIDKSPQNSYWNVEDLIQRKKHRGSIFVMDFNKDSYDVGIPEEFRADYDNIAGYDYNIDLIAPYDDVNTMNLPKI